MPAELQLLPTSEQVDVLLMAFRSFLRENSGSQTELEIAEELMLEILKKRRQQREK